jgi:hypothetical protein
MKIKKIEATEFTKVDEENLKTILSRYCKQNNRTAVSTQTIGAPFRAIYLKSDTELLLMNPVITGYSGDTILSQEVSEFDNPTKFRYVNRASKLQVQTDNLGVVVFEGNTETDKVNLDECINAQQMIDLLDGITIAEKNINQPIQREVKYERNQMVMAKSPEGMIEQIKYKHIQKFIDKGYVLM